MKVIPMANPIKDATPVQILQIEMLNQSRIYLYRRNGLWKAYEVSAFVLSRFYPDLEACKESLGIMRPGMAAIFVSDVICRKLVERFGRQVVTDDPTCLVFKTDASITYQHHTYMQWRGRLKQG